MLVNDDIGFWVKRMDEAMRKKMNHVLKPFNITASQFRVLAFLRDQGGGQATQKEIETHLGVAHPTVVGLLKRLSDKGFVAVSQDLTDRRMKNVRLTAQEAQLFAALTAGQQELEQHLLKALGKEQKQQLLHLLRQAYHSLQ